MCRLIRLIITAYINDALSENDSSAHVLRTRWWSYLHGNESAAGLM